MFISLIFSPPFNQLNVYFKWILFTSKGRLISGGSVKRLFYPDVYISRARTAIRSRSPSLPKVSALLWSA